MVLAAKTIPYKKMTFKDLFPDYTTFSTKMEFYGDISSVQDENIYKYIFDRFGIKTYRLEDENQNHAATYNR
jgi:hypothetical protein